MNERDVKLLRVEQPDPAPAAVVYRLYTEDLPGVADLVSAVFEGFTLYHTDGYWQGAREASVVVEVVGVAADRAAVLLLAENIRRENKQTAVLVTVQPVESILVS